MAAFDTGAAMDQYGRWVGAEAIVDRASCESATFVPAPAFDPRRCAI